MLCINSSQQTRRFTIDNRIPGTPGKLMHFVLAPGETADIPDRWVHMLKSICPVVVPYVPAISITPEDTQNNQNIQQAELPVEASTNIPESAKKPDPFAKARAAKAARKSNAVQKQQT